MADDRPKRKHNPAWPDPPEARAKRQAKRLARLNEVAQSLGFETWRRLETAVIRGDAVLMVEPPAGTHPSSEIIAELRQERDDLRAELDAQLATVGEGWIAPDGVEFPIGRVDVLVVREAVWRNCAEEWEDTRTDLYLHGVIAYRDKLQ